MFFENHSTIINSIDTFSFVVSVYCDNLIRDPNPSNFNINVQSSNNQNANCPDVNFVVGTISTSVSSQSIFLTNVNTLSFVITWPKIMNSNIFSTMNCFLNFNYNNVANKVALSLGQHDICRYYNRITKMSNNCALTDNCDKGNIITLVGFNFAAPQVASNNFGSIYIGNIDCLNYTVTKTINLTNGNKKYEEVTCVLPPIMGKEHFIWLNNQPIQNTNGYAYYKLTFLQFFTSSPTVNSFSPFVIQSNLYVVYPKPINVYGLNFRGSCRCVLKSNISPITSTNILTIIRNTEFLQCDYANTPNFNSSVYLNQTYFFNVVCLENSSYKSTTDFYDSTNLPNDVIYISSNTLTVIINQIKITKLTFIDYRNSSNNDVYFPGTPSFYPHSHGGYYLNIQFNSIPKCISNNECINPLNSSSKYFYTIIMVSTYLINVNCQVLSATFQCQIIHPQLPGFKKK